VGKVPGASPTTDPASKKGADKTETN